jgi:hypothetical protein
MHGGATHFPIALLLVSVLFDHAGFWWHDELRRYEFRAFGFRRRYRKCLLGEFAIVPTSPVEGEPTPG